MLWDWTPLARPSSLMSSTLEVKCGSELFVWETQAYLPSGLFCGVRKSTSLRNVWLIHTIDNNHGQRKLLWYGLEKQEVVKSLWCDEKNFKSSFLHASIFTIGGSGRLCMNCMTQSERLLSLSIVSSPKCSHWADSPHESRLKTKFAIWHSSFKRFAEDSQRLDLGAYDELWRAVKASMKYTTTDV